MLSSVQIYDQSGCHIHKSNVILLSEASFVLYFYLKAEFSYSSLGGRVQGIFHIVKTLALVSAVAKISVSRRIFISTFSRNIENHVNPTDLPSESGGSFQRIW
jgi:hypothetical protein